MKIRGWNVSNHIDKLLVVVDQLYRDLKEAAGGEGCSLDGNILIRFARYYFQRRHEPKPLESLFNLMSRDPEIRGSSYTTNWQIIHDMLEKKKGQLKKLDPEDLAYVLGWVAKLARAGV